MQTQIQKSKIDFDDEVFAKISVKGEDRKGRVYISKIEGKDPQWGLARNFVGERFSERGMTEIELEENFKVGTVFEIRDGCSWKNDHRYFVIVTCEGLYYERINVDLKKMIIKSFENDKAKEDLVQYAEAELIEEQFDEYIKEYYNIINEETNYSRLDIKRDWFEEALATMTHEEIIDTLATQKLVDDTIEKLEYAIAKENKRHYADVIDTIEAKKPIIKGEED